MLGANVPLLICPPMVKQSDLAFRLLVRNHGCNLTYSQMYPTHTITSEECLPFDTHPSDKPFIVQLCGDDPKELVRAGKLVENHCDAIDLNFGCPQQCAQVGHFGAYLLDEPDLIIEIVEAMAKNLKIPITCKIRVLETWPETISLAKRIENAGCSMLAVHGRKRAQRQHRGSVDYEVIKLVKEQLKIPVIVNGGITNISHGFKLLNETKCDGMMVATALLKNPAFYSNGPVCEVEIICEYLDLICEYFPRNPVTVRDHLVRILGREEIKRFRELDGLLHNRSMKSARQFRAWFTLYLNSSLKIAPSWFELHPVLSLKEIKLGMFESADFFTFPMSINMIVAATKSNGIGINGGLPWKIKKDMDHFRSMTTNYRRRDKSKHLPANACIMGRITWESIPKKFRPLKDRLNIVISRKPAECNDENVIFCTTMQDAIQIAHKANAPSIWIIGGEQIYKLAEPFCHQIFMTRIEQDIECDAFFNVKMDKYDKLTEPDILKQDPTFVTGIQEESGTLFEFQVWKRA